jgi:hypothetical protein
MKCNGWPRAAGKQGPSLFGRAIGLFGFNYLRVFCETNWVSREGGLGDQLLVGAALVTGSLRESLKVRRV